MMKKIFSCLLASSMLLQLLPAGALAAQTENTAPSSPTGLMVELSHEPLGVEAEYPLLSWEVNDSDPNEVQTAYRILVATDETLLQDGKADIWDSGKVTSGENTNVPYGGNALASDSIFYWTVKTWDKNDAESPYAQPQFFTTAVKDNWDADAIWHEPNDAALFREMGLTDYTLEADFTITSAAIGFTVRKATNSAAEDCGYLVQVIPGSGSATVVKTQGLGSNASASIGRTTANACGMSIVTGQSYHIKITAEGKTLRVWINDTLMQEREDFLQDSCGTFGVRCGSTETGWVDNLKVTRADGTLFLSNDFSEGCVSPFASGGTLENGSLLLGKGEKLYHVVTFTKNPTQWKDYTLECDISITNNAVGFLVRKPDFTTTLNGYMVQIRIASGSEPLVKFQRWSPSSTTKQVSASAAGISIAKNETHHVKISAVGTTLTAWIDGIKVLENDSFLISGTAGTVAVRTGNTESSYVDNLKVSGPDGVVLLESDFSSAAKNIFTGGSIVEQKLAVTTGKNICYKNETQWTQTEQRGNAVFLRKEFSVTKPVKKAILSAVGKDRAETLQYVYKLYINGDFAGLGSPRSVALTDNAKLNMYNTFDVTEQIRQGENCIGVTAYALSDKRFQGRLKLFYTDGTSEVINTNDSWVTMDGTVAFGENDNSVGTYVYTLMQENIDARVYPYGYAEPGFDDSAWDAAQVKKAITNLSASWVENTKEFTMPVEKLVDKGSGNYFIQLKKEVVGGIRLILPKSAGATAGTTLTLLYGEELESENTVKWATRAGANYQETWTLKDGAQVIEHWGMRNFRYIEIRNCPFAITADMIEAIALRQEFDETDSYLDTSDPLLNEIFEFCKYTVQATNQDLYVDSQIRERGRCDGDIYINQLTAFGVSDSYTLAHRSNEYALASLSLWSEFNKFIIINAWDDYLYTGNASLLEEYYDRIVELLYLNEQDESGLYQDSKSSLVDWPKPERGSYDVDGSYYNTVVNAFQYKALLTAAEVAELLGKTEDAARFTSEAEKLKATVNEKLYDVNSNGLYIEGMKADGTLCSGNAIHASLYPLLFDMVDDTIAQEALGQYLADTGLVGSVYFSQFYLEALYKNGQADAAMEVLTGTGLRSWYHMINDLNATIACEAWDPSIKSNMTFSHPWGASAGNIIVRHTFGVQPLEAGFEKIQIKPQLGALEYGTLKTPTIKGSVVVSVQNPQDGAGFTMTTTTPANTVAQVYVPAAGSEIDILLVDGVAVQAQREGDFLVVEVGSGTHSFTLSNGVTMVTPDGTEVSAADPIAAWKTGKYSHIKLYENTYAIDLNGLSVTLDLNGCDLTVTGSGKLLAFDSANDTYDASVCGNITNAGTVEIAADHTAPNGNRYIALTENGGYSFHRLALQLNAVTLRTNKAGIYYKAEMVCDEALAAQIDRHGIAVSILDMPDAGFAQDADTMYTEISGAPEGIFTSGSIVNIFREGVSPEKNARRGEMNIYANPYLKLKDGTVLMAQEGSSWSLQDVLIYLNTNFEALDAQTQANAKTFCEAWTDAIAPWNLQNLVTSKAS